MRYTVSMPRAPTHERYPEIDLLRTLAVAMMIIYHGAYDLFAYAGWDLNPFQGGWWLLARGTATLFLLLVGISFSISFARTRAQTNQGDAGISANATTKKLKTIYPKYLRRAAIVFGCGMLVSLATYIADPATFVRFGILHMIGISLLLLPFFAPFAEANIFVGLLCIILGNISKDFTVSTWLLLPLGLMPPSFETVDYFPLLPWFGVILFGVACGHFLYIRSPHWRQSFSAYRVPLPAILTWPGRNALLIYLLHQPILLGVLWLIQRH